MKFSVSETTALIRNRRTIYPKDYTDRVVHREIVEQVLTNGTYAPTHGMTQPWRFVVFSGAGRERLATFMGEEYRHTTPAEKFLQRKYDNMVQRPLKSSVVVGIGMEHDPEGKISLEDDTQAVACAVQNMLLTCTAYGLGAFWGTGKVLTGTAMRDFLGLGPNGRCLGLMYMGDPAIEWPKGYRKPLDQLVSWHEQ